MSRQDQGKATPPTHERLFTSLAREWHYRRIAATQPGSVRRRSWERRYPLLYRPLVEFVLAIPWHEKITPDLDRVIQRRAIEGIVPESVRVRRHKGDHTPVVLEGLRVNWPRVQTFAAGERLAGLGLVEPRLFRLACERMRHGLNGTTGPDGPLLLGALSLEMWLALRESHRRTPSEQRSELWGFCQRVIGQQAGRGAGPRPDFAFQT